MARRKSALITVFLLCVLLGVASGTLRGEIPALEEETFRVYGERVFRDLYFSSVDGLPRELRFFGNFRSPEYTYTGPRTVVFYRLPEGFSETAYLEYIDRSESPVLYPPGAEIVASVNWPETMENPLFIFFRREGRSTEGPEFVIFPFDDSTNAFPWQSLVIFNASRMSLGGRVGSATHQFSAGPSEPFRVNRSVNVRMATRRSDGVRTVFDGPVEVGSDERVLMLLLPPVLRGSTEVQYRIVRQLRQEEPEELKALDE